MRTVNERIVFDGVDDLFADRWSARSFTGERIEDDAFRAVLEAARWAPSSRNAQPWRILYAHREMPEWDTFVELLNESNAEWAHAASHLALFLSEENSPSKAFDVGAAWMSFALQATMLELATHPMGGFKKDKALTALSIPDGYAPMAMVALGRVGSPDDLPEHRQASERSRSDRMSIEEIAHKGSWPESW